MKRILILSLSLIWSLTINAKGGGGGHAGGHASSHVSESAHVSESPSASSHESMTSHETEPSTNFSERTYNISEEYKPAFDESLGYWRVTIFNHSTGLIDTLSAKTEYELKTKLMVINANDNNSDPAKIVLLLVILLVIALVIFVLLKFMDR